MTHPITPFPPLAMKQSLLLAILLALFSLTLAQAHAQSPKPGQFLDIKPAADGKSFTITPRISQESPWGLIELVDPKTSHVQRVLYAGHISRETPVTLTVDDSLKPGPYLLRLRDGISLAFEKPILRPDSPSGKWVCPSQLALHNGSLFIGEAGAHTPDMVPQRSPELTWATRDGKTVKGTCVRVQEGNALIMASDPALGVVPVDPEKQTPELAAVAKDVQKQTADWRALIQHNQPFVVKLNPDLTTTSTNWGDKGYWRDVPCGGGAMHAMVVDDAGSLYMPTGDMAVCTVGTLGILEKRIIGDFTGNAPRSLAVAGPNKIYVIPYTGYQKIHVADRTKAGALAYLYSTAPFRNGSWITNALAADPDGSLYMADPVSTLVKYTDTGKAIEENYFTTPHPQLHFLGGLHLSKKLIWAVAHGPGPGPFWDSGGGGEIALFFDNGKSLSIITRIGSPGQNTDPIEFLNPRSIIMTPDHKQLIIAEDGIPNADGPPGNARVSLYKIKAAIEDTTPIQITK